MSTQPVFAADYVEGRSRLTTFFRPFMVIPHAIVLGFYGIAAICAVIGAWFAIVFTGRYPEGLYAFVAGFQRYSTKVYGYGSLMTDVFPPFNGSVDDYPARLIVPAPKAQYSRAKTAFRLILAIPVMIILYAMQIVWEVGTCIAWFAIVILGRQPKGLQDMIELGISYQQRSGCYFLLLTEDWPPFTQSEGASAGGGGGPDVPPVDAPPPVGPTAAQG